MTSKSPVRSCEDVDEAALSYAEIKALCAGNPLIREKMDLDIEVARLRLLKADYQSQRYKLENAILKTLPAAIESAKEKIAGYMADQERLETWTLPNKDGFSPMVINRVTYAEKAEAGQALLDACTNAPINTPAKSGTYRGFDLYLSFDALFQEYKAVLKGAMHYDTALGTNVHGNITRLNNALNNLPDLLMAAKERLEDSQRQLDTAKDELTKPFPMETELAAKAERLAALDSQLNMDAKSEVPDDAATEKEPEKDGRESEQESVEKADAMPTPGHVPSVGINGRIIIGTIPKHSYMENDL